MNKKTFTVNIAENAIEEVRDTARTPSFDGVETVSWGDVSKTFEAYRDGVCSGTFEGDAPGTIGDAPQELKTCIASKSLLGDAQADTFDQVLFFPVVNPSTNKLNAGALRAVLGGRGAAADIPAAARDSAQAKARGLLDSEFKQEETAEMDYESIKAHIDTIMEHLVIIDEMLMQAVTNEEPPRDTEKPMDTAGDTDTETSELSELATPVVSLLEQETPVDRRAPLSMTVGIIKVGPGNKRDNHYYTREMLERDGKVFEGLTMHVVDHREEQRSEQTDVSTIKEVVGVRDLKDGAYLVANVTAYDPDFCEKTRNRASVGELDKLQCSILARGEAVAGEIDGEKYNVVNSITEGRFVDWVTRAGAGGKVIALAENEPEPEPTEPPADVQEVDIEEAEGDDEQQTLSMSEVLTELGKTNLPARSIVALTESYYATIEELETAITAEIARLKAAGSGQPFVNPKQQTSNRRPTRAEIREAQAAVNSKWLSIGGHK